MRWVFSWEQRGSILMSRNCWRRSLFSTIAAPAAALLGTMLVASSAFAQVDVTASAGTANASYTTLKGAFDAINAGTHQGTITIGISASTTEGTTPATLNSGGAGSASYTSVLIQPTTDGVSI